MEESLGFQPHGGNTVGREGRGWEMLFWNMKYKDNTNTPGNNKITVIDLVSTLHVLCAAK